MDWTLALHRNHTMLRRLVAGLFLVAGIGEGGSVRVMPRYRRLALLSVLRPAESACRRVILLAVFVWSVTARPRPERRAQSPRGPSEKTQISKGLPAFGLVDPRKRFGLVQSGQGQRPRPRITVFGAGDAGFDRSETGGPQGQSVPMPDDEIDAGRLCARLNALNAALADLPQQARRMAGREARIRARPLRRGKPQRAALRPGWPPGYRARPVHGIDEVLAECHRLARRAVQAPDTS